MRAARVVGYKKMQQAFYLLWFGEFKLVFGSVTLTKNYKTNSDLFSRNKATDSAAHNIYIKDTKKWLLNVFSAQRRHY